MSVQAWLFVLLLLFVVILVYGAWQHDVFICASGVVGFVGGYIASVMESRGNG